MKIFSMFFTVVFFLGFTSISYAEPIYTITSKLTTDDDELYIYMTDKVPYDELEEKLPWLYGEGDIMDIYKIIPNECIRVTASQFGTLNVIEDDGLLPGTITPLCRYDRTCKPHNYEVINNHVLQAIDQPNGSLNCTDIERWMQIKEQNFLRNN